MLTSLRGKLILIFLAITVTAVAISTGYSKYIHTRVAVERAEEMARDNLKLIASELQTMNQWIIRDLFAIRDLPQFKDLVESRHSSDYGMKLTETGRAFLSHSKHHHIFHQIRYLDNNGMEIIRVNSDGLNSTLVPAGELQPKGHRYYFKETFKLRHGQVYISPLDLNVERAMIERPHVPVIRYGTPITDHQGKRRGVIIFNVFGDEILQVMARHQDFKPHGNTYLLDAQGYYLYHPNRAYTFGFMTGSNENFARLEPALASWIHKKDKDLTIKKSYTTGEQTIFAYLHVPLATRQVNMGYHNQDKSLVPENARRDIVANLPHWILLAAIKETDFLPGFDKYSKMFYLFAFMLLLACVLVAVLVSLGISRPVVSLASAARRIQKGDLSARADVFSNDEMGEFGNLFNKMASNLEASHNNLKLSERKYRHLFENSRDCFFVLDSTCKIEDINKAGLTLLGYEEDNLPEHFTMSFCQEGSVELQSFKEIIVKYGFVKDYEINLQRPNGTTKICMLSANTRLDENGTLLGYEGVLRDITLERERQKAEQRFQQKLREEIILAEEKERRSLSLALHEDLAQNLALLHLQIQESENMLSPEKLPADQAKSLKQKKSLNKSLTLINTMIERIRNLVFDLYPVMLDKHGLIPAMQWYAQNFSERTSIPVSLFDTEKTIDLSKPQQIYLFRAFKELLHNAFKHSEATEIVVTISEDEGRLRLTVDDDGVGFEPQKELDDSSTSVKGLGLFNIKEWITAMNGDLQIESMAGQGTRIIIGIPLLYDIKGIE